MHRTGVLLMHVEHEPEPMHVGDHKLRLVRRHRFALDNVAANHLAGERGPKGQKVRSPGGGIRGRQTEEADVPKQLWFGQLAQLREVGRQAEVRQCLLGIVQFDAGGGRRGLGLAEMSFRHRGGGLLFAFEELFAELACTQRRQKICLGPAHVGGIHECQDVSPLDAVPDFLVYPPDVAGGPSGQAGQARASYSTLPLAWTYCRMVCRRAGSVLMPLASTAAADSR